MACLHIVNFNCFTDSMTLFIQSTFYWFREAYFFIKRLLVCIVIFSHYHRPPPNGEYNIPLRRAYVSSLGNFKINIFNLNLNIINISIFIFILYLHFCPSSGENAYFLSEKKLVSWTYRHYCLQVMVMWSQFSL